MKQLLKVLGKFKFYILFVVILLVMQAFCELSLPEYTSKIINVGIQQSGIESEVLEVVRESEYNKILLFTTEDDKETLDKNYKLITKGDKEYLEEYPALKEENLYILKSDSNEKEVSKTLSFPVVFISFLENDSIDFSKMFPSSPVEVTKDNIFEMLSMMDKNSLNLFVTSVKEKYSNMEDSIIKQAMINYAKSEYNSVGINVDEIQTKYIIFSGLKMLGISLIAMALTILSTFISSRVAAFFSRDLREKVVGKIISFSNTEFERFSSASLITRSTNDIQQIQMLIIMSLRMLLYAPILGIGAYSKVGHDSMGWIIGLAVLVISVIVVTLFVFVMPKFKKVQTLVDKLNLKAREILNGILVIRAFSNEEKEIQKFDMANKDLTKVNLFVTRAMYILMPSMLFIMNAVSVLIIWVGAKKIDAGVVQIGDLMAFITYTIQIIMAFLILSFVSIMIPRAIVSIKRISEVLNSDSVVKDPEKAKKFNSDKKGVIEFKDVYFRYPDAEEDVLHNISFNAYPKTTTAFIGSTGCGKSTLVNLIPRFFDVTGGKILIDGINIKDVKLKELRRKIGYVPQKGLLFSGTINSNIKLGDDKLNKEEIIEAAKISQSLEFIEEKENKFDEDVSQGGNNLSGGQKQRLSIARALAINPDILIFDDSFSALDYKTDVKLRKSLFEKMKDKTILIVAQRIGTIINADQIIVLEDGEIVGIGKHKDLMKSCKVYKEIALSQLSKEELENA